MADITKYLCELSYNISKKYLNKVLINRMLIEKSQLLLRKEIIFQGRIIQFQFQIAITDEI